MSSCRNTDSTRTKWIFGMLAYLYTSDSMTCTLKSRQLPQLKNLHSDPSLILHAPGQTPPVLPRLAPRHLLSHPFAKLNTPFWHKSHEPRVLLIPPRPFESAHRTAVVVCREVRLRAVFVHNVEQAEGED